MTLFSNIFRRISNWRRPRPPANIEERLLWLLRPYLATLEHVLLWNNPPLSLGFLLFVNTLVWVLRVSGVPVLGLVGGVLTGAVVLDAIASAGRGRLRGGGREDPQGPPAPCLHAAAQCAQQHLTTTYIYLRDLRRENHSKFCVLVSASIAALWLVVWMGGSLLLHGALTAALLAPLAPSLHSTLVAAMHQHAESDGEMEGFLPELSALALQELQQAGEQPLPPPSLTADLSLPADVGSALRYAAGEESSSEGEGEEDSIGREGEPAGRRVTTPDPPSTDTTDSDTEFLLHDRTKKARVPETGGWLSALRPSAPLQQKDSDSDEFELIDKDDL